MRRSACLLGLVGTMSGCCFGDFAAGFSEGFTLQTECEAVIQSSNAATARIEALPDPFATLGDGTPEQIAAAMEPMAQAYERASAELSAISVTHPGLLANRDALAALYLESAGVLRAQSQAVAAAQAGDEAALNAAAAAGEALGPREDAIIAQLNAVCQRQ